MQLTRYTDYALRVLIYLAHRKDRLATIREISDAYRISENHVMKIVHDLAKLGYIETLRGKGGGLKLARVAERINLGSVVRDTEETLHAVECLADDYAGSCGLAPDCKLKSALRAAQSAFMAELDRHTLKDLVPARAATVLRFYKPVAAAASGAATRR
jgi:Rrf2 family nitric oxide-sensitive transcriptional repressor